MSDIRVSIYEDNSGLRDVLSTIINGAKGFVLTGAYEQCSDVIQNTRSSTPDVIIMDIDMPGMNGIEGVKILKPIFPDIEVIMNTVFDDDERIFLALQAGATGYLLKKNSLSTLLNSIQEVYNGGAPMSPSIARKVLQLPFAKGNASSGKNNLTERELEILNLLAQGLSYKMVAAELILSLDTIRTYVKRIYEKLHVHSVTEAVHKVYINK
ncbi:MAG: response regulator transcription factor [Saprospiraceae bacterium]